MKTDLLDLLARTAIVHPTRIAAVEAGPHELRITIAGYPWWHPVEAGLDQRIVFSLEGVREGVLDAATLLDMDDDEALEFFSVTRLEDEPWADGGTSYSIYCSAPLRDPVRLFTAVEEYLKEAEAPRSVSAYLNVPDDSLAGLLELSAKGSFLLAEAPEALRDVIITELRDQGVAHNVLQSQRPKQTGLFVQIGNSWVVCAAATAAF